MADDFDYDDGYLDMDDGWIYVEDEFDIADELAEGQIADPGYAGTNHEIDLEGYEYDLFGYWDDLEYADDAYWDYGLPSKDNGTGQKRKRVTDIESSLDKRKKAKTDIISDSSITDRDAEPLLFRSRHERNKSLRQDAPRCEDQSFALLPDWKQKFANEDGSITSSQMPEAMKRAAEAQESDASPRPGRSGMVATQEGYEDGDWEDEVDDEEEELSLDPEMLKSVLREKFGAAGMDGMDEEVFMQTIQNMMSGDGGGDAAGELANALLGKITSQDGDEAVSGWLSQQGVSLEEGDDDDDDDACSVATSEMPSKAREGAPAHAETTADNAMNMAQYGTTKKMSLHSTSPPSSSKKRPAESQQPDKKQKKVKFDVPSSSPAQAQVPDENDSVDAPSSEDPLASGSTVRKRTKAERDLSTTAATDETASKSRKRKPAAEETNQVKPPAKRTRSREVEMTGDASPAPPAKRTRSARAKGVK